MSALGVQNVFQKLTQVLYLDHVLKIAGVTGFILTYLNAWRTMGVGLKLGFICSAAAWFVGARLSKIYR